MTQELGSAPTAAPTAAHTPAARHGHLQTDTRPPDAMVRLVFREVQPGDRRKFVAQSNDSDSGGGARDFRFSPYAKFKQIFELMLSSRVTQTRKNRTSGVSEKIELYQDVVHVVKGPNTTIERKIEFWLPTPSRDSEGRLARLHTYDLDVPSEHEGRIFLLLYQTNDGKLWLNFATQTQLLNNEWTEEVTDLLLGCMCARRREGVAANGFLDLIARNRFCNGK